jgi:hypothetical protein
MYDQTMKGRTEPSHFSGVGMTRRQAVEIADAIMLIAGQGGHAEDLPESGYCKTCTYWEEMKVAHRAQGICRCSKFSAENGPEQDGLYYPEGEIIGQFYTGPYFSCIHSSPQKLVDKNPTT